MTQQQKLVHKTLLTHVNNLGVGIFVGDPSTSKAAFEVNFETRHTQYHQQNADANGYGNYEYSVPTGYYALNAVNIAQYGG